MKNSKYLETNGDFAMRQLTEEDLDQFNALLRYAFQVTTDELLKTGWTEDEIKYAKAPVLGSSYVLGWFYKGNLASMIVVYPMKVNIHDNICDMGGITAVSYTHLDVYKRQKQLSAEILSSRGEKIECIRFKVNRADTAQLGRPIKAYGGKI